MDKIELAKDMMNRMEKLSEFDDDIFATGLKEYVRISLLLAKTVIEEENERLCRS